MCTSTEAIQVPFTQRIQFFSPRAHSLKVHDTNYLPCDPGQNAQCSLGSHLLFHTFPRIAGFILSVSYIFPQSVLSSVSHCQRLPSPSLLLFLSTAGPQDFHSSRKPSSNALPTSFKPDPEVCCSCSRQFPYMSRPSYFKFLRFCLRPFSGHRSLFSLGMGQATVRGIKCSKNNS